MPQKASLNAVYNPHDPPKPFPVLSSNPYRQTMAPLPDDSGGRIDNDPSAASLTAIAVESTPSRTTSITHQAPPRLPASTRAPHPPERYSSRRSFQRSFTNDLPRRSLANGRMLRILPHARRVRLRPFYLLDLLHRTLLFAALPY